VNKRGGRGGRGSLQKLVNELMSAAAWEGKVGWLLECGVRTSINQDAVEKIVARHKGRVIAWGFCLLDCNTSGDIAWALVS
jgi:hypothetical protein